ncbi:MAG TPA: calcium/sodium antiporter [Burkholderiales bacterium]|nr:calcium/sodium antiporter [Burkholderiales bacterium]
MALLDLAQIAGGLIALYFGADWLVGAATAVARRLGVSPLLVGLTVVALGTSLPELVVGVRAALRGHAGISLGNVVGANAINIGLVLGTAALIRPLVVQLRVLKWDLPAMLVAALLMSATAADGEVGRLEGAVLLAGMAGYVALNVVLARGERTTRALERFEAGVEPPAAALWREAARGAGGLVALFVGAELLIAGALAIAATLGASEGIVGLTVVAAGTTLPELVTAIVAATRNQGDIAFGNVIGSNIANALAVVGASSVIRPLPAGDLGWPAIGGMLALSLLSVPVMWRGFRVTRAEGAVLIAGYLAFLTLNVRAQ